MFDLKDPTNRDRVAMLQAGTGIIDVRSPDAASGRTWCSRSTRSTGRPTAVEPTPPHLHNVPLQIAAERGLPALGVWIWFVVTVIRGLLVRMRRGDRARYLAAAGLGAVAAMLAAGLFEYNFGDSEFLMLLLVLVTLPWAAALRPSQVRPPRRPPRRVRPSAARRPDGVQHVFDRRTSRGPDRPLRLGGRCSSSAT